MCRTCDKGACNYYISTLGAENSDIYRDISMYANIEGFLTYGFIYDVYRQALFLGFTMVLY